MINKKIMIVTIILAFLLSVSMVCAEDNDTNVGADLKALDDENSVDGDVNDFLLGEDQTGEIITFNNDSSFVDASLIDDNKLSNEWYVSKKTFKDIQNTINAASASDKIKLSGTYFGSGEKIVISKAISLVGDGETVLDAKGLSKILEISESYVTIENIKFINGFDRYVGSGIFCTGGADYVTLKHCTFFNNTNTQDGGHIYWAGNYGKLYDCNFIGGNIDWRGTYAGIYYSNFDNTIVEIDSYKHSINNCIFKSGKAYIRDSENPINKCTFIDTDKSIMNYHNLINCKFCDSTILYASDVNTYYGSSEKLIVTLTDTKGNILTDKFVTINVGTISETIKTNFEGQVSILVSKLVPETYVATIKFEGDDCYLASNIIVNVIVKKTVPKITANAKTFKTTEKTKKYSIKLKDYKGNAMKNVKVTLKVNGKTYSAKTNKNGQATFKITKLTKKGTYTATVKFAGNNTCEFSNKKVKITVTKPITSKSVKLDVVYSYTKFPKKKLGNGDVIMTTYEKYSGRQWSPGVYATVTHGVGLLKAKNTKLVKCAVWFKNNKGKIITKFSSKFQYNWYIKVGLQKGYTPYKAKIWYTKK